MKIVAIGDIHGRDLWMNIARDQEDADKIVFVGDYWDSFTVPAVEQIANFKNIIQFKEENPEQVELLLGNHDCHYLPSWTMIGEAYTGYQAGVGYQISGLMQEHLSLFKIAYMHDNHLFTHAGVTKTWLNSTMKLPPDVDVDFGVPIDEYINDVFKNTATHFWFNGNDGYGDDVTQSPIWVRPESLNEDATNHIHIVGHTGVKRIGIEPTYFRERGAGLFIDTLGSSGEYLIIEDGKYSIGQI